MVRYRALGAVMQTAGAAVMPGVQLQNAADLVHIFSVAFGQLGVVVLGLAFTTCAGANTAMALILMAAACLTYSSAVQPLARQISKRLPKNDLTRAKGFATRTADFLPVRVYRRSWWTEPPGCIVTSSNTPDGVEAGPIFSRTPGSTPPAACRTPVGRQSYSSRAPISPRLADEHSSLPAPQSPVPGRH